MTLEKRIAALAARHRTELPDDLRRALVDLVWEVASLTRCDAEEAATAQEREACAELCEERARRLSGETTERCAGGLMRAATVSANKRELAESLARAIRARGTP